jgi:hypothetical protein
MRSPNDIPNPNRFKGIAEGALGAGPSDGALGAEAGFRLSVPLAGEDRCRASEESEIPPITS